MTKYTGAINLTSGTKINSALPIDDRFVFTNITDRDTLDLLRRFEGMFAFVESEGKNYQLVGGILNSNWILYGGGEDNFSYKKIETEETATIPANQQMLYIGEIENNGEMIIEGEIYSVKEGASSTPTEISLNDLSNVSTNPTNGDYLYFNSVSGEWESQAFPASPITYFTETGNLLHSINTSSDFAVGTASISSTISVGCMFFDRAGASFRAGRAFGTQWDSVNRGLMSFATGRDTIASGDYAFSVGYSNTVSGDYAFSAGRNNTVSGFAGLAIGQSCGVYGFASIALGNSSTVYGSNSVVIGSSRAYGNNSFASGPANWGYSYAETAIGSYGTTYVANSTTAWDIRDRLFYIGCGFDSGSRANAITIYKSGLVELNQQVKMDKGLRIPLTKTTLNISVSDDNQVIIADQSSSSIIVSLPAVHEVGRVFTVKRIGNNIFNTVTISGNGSNIDGSATKILSNNEANKLISDGSNWFII